MIFEEATMKPIIQQKITDYLESNIKKIHQRRLANLQKLKLMDVVKQKNPYLFNTKNTISAPDFVEIILTYRLSSQEETLFDDFHKELAIFICSHVYGGQKSSVEGIDLALEKDNITYIVSINSDPNWDNSNQISKLQDNFRKAKQFLSTNSASSNIIAIGGCCYGNDRNQNKGSYLKLSGGKFWEFISDDYNLYTDIIVPLGHKITYRNEQFMEEYAKVVNRFTLEFMTTYCDSDGSILWEEIVKFNSGETKS